MPHVTVTLKHTPKPDDDVAFVEFEGDPKGLAVHFGHGRVWIEPEDLSSNPSLTPAEAIALARALALVAGCADPRWRGFHWRAEEANGNELGETPLGQWYVSRDDCEKAVRTLFGTDSTVIYDGAPGSLDKILRLPAGIVAHAAENDAIRAQIAADDTPEAEQ